MQNEYNIIVEKKLNLDQAEKVKAFNEKVKEIIGDVTGIEISVNVELGAGVPYDTIK